MPHRHADAAVQEEQHEEGQDVDGARDPRDVDGQRPRGVELRPAVRLPGLRRSQPTNRKTQIFVRIYTGCHSQAVLPLHSHQSISSESVSLSLKVAKTFC